MAIIQYKPTTPSRRGTSCVAYRNEIDRVEPLKAQVVSKHRKAGRNSDGRITTRHRGGGARQHYRLIDFKRSKRDVSGRVEYIEYDPNRTCFIARVLYTDGDRRYILAPNGLKKGDEILAADRADVKTGNAMSLANIPLGTSVHNVEMKPGKGGQLARSAGVSCQLIGRIEGFAQLKMPSGEMRRVPVECFATIGQVGNTDHFNISIGKAGRARHMGIRPTVRGVAMNPVDHPHGGGEGKTSGGRHPVSPWALPTKGYKTRHNKRTNKDIIRRRNKK